MFPAIKISAAIGSPFLGGATTNAAFLLLFVAVADILVTRRHGGYDAAVGKWKVRGGVLLVVFVGLW